MVKREFIDTTGWTKDRVLKYLVEHGYGHQSETKAKAIVNQGIRCISLHDGVAEGHDYREYFIRNGYKEIKEMSEFTHVFNPLSNSILIKGEQETNIKCRILQKLINLPSSDSVNYYNSHVIETESGAIWFCQEKNLKEIMPDIKIGKNIVQFSETGIKVGCTSVSKETILAIAERFAKQ